MTDTTIYVPEHMLDELVTREDVLMHGFETWEECEDAYEELLNEVYDEVVIGHSVFSAGEIMRALDPVTFRVGVGEGYVEVDLNDYPSEDDTEEDED